MSVVSEHEHHPVSESNSSVNSANNLPPKRLWQKLMRQKALFLTTLLGVLALSALWCCLITPQYRSVSTLQILPPADQAGDPGQAHGTTSDKHESELSFNTDAEQIKSRKLVEKVITQLNLEERLFHHDFDTELKKKLKAQADYMLAPAKALYEKIRPSLPAGAENTPPVDRDYVREFLEKLSVEPVEKTRLIRVSYESPDPELSAQIANSLVKTFIHETKTRKIKADTYTDTYLGMELESASRRLKDSEEALAEYNKEKETSEPDNDDKLVDQRKKLADLTAALSMAKRRKIEIENQLSITRKQGNAEGSLKSTAVDSLQKQLKKLKADYAEKSEIFKPAYPDMQDLNRDIKIVERRLDNATNALEASLEAKLSTASKLENELDTELLDYREQMGEVRDYNAESNVLRQEVETNRKLYDNLLKHQQHMKSSEVSSITTTDNARMVDQAKPASESFSPDKWRIMLFGLLAGLLLATLFALLRAALSHSLHSADEIQSVSGLPVLGIIPFIKKHQRNNLALAVVRDVGSQAAEAYRLLATNLKLLIPAQDDKPCVIMVTSVSPGEGKSTSSINLALSQAQMGNKVLLIDADLRRSSIHRKMGLNNHLGLTEYLYGDAELSKVTRHFDEMKDTYIITSGLLKLDPVEALSSARMAELIEMTRTYFDITIIDAPPVTGFADSLLLAEMADATLLVTREGVDDKRELTRTLDQLQRAGQKILGLLVVGARQGVVDHRYYQRYKQRTVIETKPPIPVSAKNEMNLVRKRNLVLH